MERRNFFKILAGAIGASVVAPHVLAEETPESNVFVADRNHEGTTLYKNGESVIIDVSKLDSRYSIEEILRIWRETGMLIYEI